MLLHIVRPAVFLLAGLISEYDMLRFVSTPVRKVVKSSPLSV